MCRDILLRAKAIFQRELEGRNESRDIMTYLGAYSYFDVDTLINSLYTPPEPDSRALSPEGEYDEPMPENYEDMMQKLEQGIDFLVEDLIHEFMFNNDDELRAMLTRILNNPNPANHSDELRALLEGGDVLNDVVESIEYHHLDINEVVDYALYNLNLRRRRPWLYYE